MGNRYQYALIGLLLLVAALFLVFFYREVNPEYKHFQRAYVALEEFRARVNDTTPPPFEMGVKQIVIKNGQGPEQIDRCTSCHVALEVEAFSPTMLKRDAAGLVLRDSEGTPIQVHNPDYIWSMVDAHMTDELRSLKVVHIGDRSYDMEKLLRMHPLMGKEERPFQFHPLDQYGCTTCHSGNGRALTVEKAHGPVFDGEYEVSHEGPKPQFLELDPKNDPQFARMFNHKPGHSILFQTTPILEGGLIESRCVQCHKADEKEIAPFVTHYVRGQELYVSQACYACHRISGFSRGGVGPELSQEGLKYPWFIKESMVWPQADLKSSTMPNYRLDHEELEDLMTFLLAKRGQDQTESPVEWRRKIRLWERGEKTAQEMPIELKSLESVESGMMTFALDGCAACHRLKGYTSSVGLKAKDLDKWFSTLFREDVGSSELVHILENHQDEIKANIAVVKPAGLLDKIEAVDPMILPSFNAPFKYAFRVHEELAWKELVRQVMLVYYEQYGLGRMIGPKPNWSGVYRSDQWLMEHFWNPSAHVARSIMPVFPFDDTKFWQLTYMLDVLGKQNRDQVKEIWDKSGFNPEEAFSIHCAQCHGTSRKGNGPVAEWIYPIPKNLRNAEFLRNLTKERAVDSIVHGVKGTPMAPFGEVHPEKGEGYEPPVITRHEAEQIVDWLFKELPGQQVVTDVPKWNYFPQGEEEFFDVFTNKSDGVDKNIYMLKEQYRTKENIESGQKLFLLQCAMCHGTEGDGGGLRSETMDEAKPRMLTNLDWISTRDDLRLLRSIKYGVPGTAMTSFGETTTPLQRMQLVVFIRDLSRAQKDRAALKSKLFEVFDTSKRAVLESMKANALLIDTKDHQINQLKHELSGPRLITEDDESGGLLNRKFAILSILEQEVSQLSKKQALMEELKNLLSQEEESRYQAGNAMISKGEPIESYLQSLDQFGRIIFNGEKLSFLSGQMDKVQLLINEIQQMDSSIREVEGQEGI